MVAGLVIGEGRAAQRMVTRAVDSGLFQRCTRPDELVVVVVGATVDEALASLGGGVPHSRVRGALIAKAHSGHEQQVDVVCTRWCVKRIWAIGGEQVVFALEPFTVDTACDFMAVPQADRAELGPRLNLADLSLSVRPRGRAVPVGEERSIINPGGVGQPRDRDPRPSYAIYDSQAGTIQRHRVTYDIKETQRKMRLAGLPTALIERLDHGY